VKNKSPVIIVVEDNRWECLGDPANSRHKFLYETLVRQGGIAESVPDGKYEYNVMRKGFRLVASLEPIQN